MNRRFLAYLALVTLLATAVLAVAPWESFLGLPRDDIAGLLVLAAIGILSEALASSVVVGGNPATSSIAFLPFFSAVVLFGAPGSYVVPLLVIVGTSLVARRRAAYKVLFNTAQTVLAIAVASGLYGLLGGTVGRAELSSLPAYFALAASFFLMNQALTSGAIALTQGADFRSTFRSLADATNLLNDVLVSPIALVIALLFREMGILGIVIFILPLFVIRHSYAAKLQLQQANRDLLTVLIKAIETRDPYTSGHSIRVSESAGRIARQLKISRRQIAEVETAALLHDIGKIDIEFSSIIAKPSSLLPEEREVIQSHAVKGAELLQKIASLGQEIILSVRHHHERFDGTGYPDRLAGQGIPIAARIIMIADSVDAMLSDRPYRKALGLDHVQKELIEGSGTQFDPDIVASIIGSGLLEETLASMKGHQAKFRVVAKEKRFVAV